MNHETQWPADAPEWANHLLCAYTEDELDTGRKTTVWKLERPKPAKQKIDWSKLRKLIRETTNNLSFVAVLPTHWIAWNCDEHTRGNPLPDGLVVEWYGLLRGPASKNNSGDINWTNDITRFRIVGIQDGFE